MAKVLITGGAGFIGLHLAKYYLSMGHKIDLADNFSRGINDEELSEVIKNPNVTLFTVDLMEKSSMSKLADDYDYIYHLAAIIGVANVLKQPYNVLEKNAVLLLNMIDFARKQKNLKRFMFASTSEVYAGTLLNFEMQIPTPEITPLCTTDLKAARTSYMLSKIYGEALCNASGLPVTIFRPHNIYGPRMGMAHVIPELLKKSYSLKENEKLDVFSPEHKRTFCYIDDAIKILYLAAECDKTLNETINLGNQNPEVNMKTVAQIVLKTVGKNNELNLLPPTEGSPERRCPDMSKTTNLTGYKAQISLEDGVKKTYDWYKVHYFEKESVSV